MRRHFNNQQTTVLALAVLIEGFNRLSEQNGLTHILPAVLRIELFTHFVHASIDSRNEARSWNVDICIDNRIHFLQERLAAWCHHRRVVWTTHTQESCKHTVRFTVLDDGIEQVRLTRHSTGIRRVRCRYPQPRFLLVVFHDALNEFLGFLTTQTKRSHLTVNRVE